MTYKQLIGIILIVLITGCVQTQTPTKTIEDTQKNEVTPYPYPTIPPTPIPTPTGYIKIEYSTKKLDKIIDYNGYTYPPQGMQFLLFDMKVTNKGYIVFFQTMFKQGIPSPNSNISFQDFQMT